ncbi:MAG: CPBP family glutamic-type intramembrane protease [Candidatus Thermoplasmatota archaeon]|nr:CPBP family glutamic-type intramembrane protease [Candidatus Thermoplasmatota archaeon]
MPETADPSEGISGGLFYTVVFSIGWAIAFLFLLISIFSIYSPQWVLHFSQTSYPYFFILLLEVPIHALSDVYLYPIVFVLYLLFFGAMIYVSIKWKGNGFLSSPIEFYAAMAAFGLTITLFLTLLLEAVGIPIGGASIQTSLEQHPFESYLALIYAPFAEETGFRIIPLGIMAVVLLRKYHPASWFDYVKVFFLPGHVRRKYGEKFGKVDYIMIAATSILFAYAHEAYGLWSWGKIITVLPVAVILAVGFLKFGVYMDIPIHWLFNGFTSLYIVNSAMEVPTSLALVYEIFMGIVAGIFLLVSYNRWKARNRPAVPEHSDVQSDV